MTEVSTDLDAALRHLAQRSVQVILDGQDAGGGYIASPTFPTYAYSWFRDGAFIADAMSRHGQVASADAFHRWAEGVVLARADQVIDLVARHAAGEDPAPEEHLRTRYTLDGQDADGFWENFQLDGYGTWLWALRQHAERHHGGALPVDAQVLELLVPYLSAFWAVPSYDWWEEHLEHTHTSTLACLWAGLDAVAGWEAVATPLRDRAGEVAAAIRQRILTEGVVDGSLVKWIGSTAVDGSLIACLTPFGLLDPDDPVARRTVERVEDELTDGGVHRFLADTYYGGGQWVLLAAFLAWHHLRAGDRGRADELLAWIADQADDAGHLPEQTAARMRHPSSLPEWQARWGPSADPLLWSHAMLLSALAERGDR